MRTLSHRSLAAADLSDVDAGGGTKFPDLQPPITVMPRKGRALVWPSVLDTGSHGKTDSRTHHEALPVELGNALKIFVVSQSVAWSNPSSAASHRRMSCRGCRYRCTSTRRRSRRCSPS